MKIRIPTAATCVLLLAALVVPSCRGDASLPRLPDTTRGIHLEMVFDYGVPDGFRFSGVDAVWAATKPVSGRLAFYYVPFERAAEDYHSPGWWKANHPDWIEYRCDHSWATEFGHSEPALDIANPAVRQWQWTTEILPALQQGYQGIAFDNLNLDNFHGRCGHYDQSGKWVNQYSGPGGVQNYQQDVLSWARYMIGQLHGAGRLMAINYSYSPDVSWDANLALMSLPDLMFDEAGVTNNGSTNDNIASYPDWQLIFRSARELQRRGVCYHLNGEEPQSTGAIPLSEREWVIGNYLLLKARCTFVYITGFRVDPSQTTAVHAGGLVQDYGYYDNFPEYRLPIGAPLGQPRSYGGLWTRPYTRGLVLVNPTDRSRRYRTRRALYAVGTFVRTRRFMIPAHSALIILNRPAH